LAGPGKRKARSQLEAHVVASLRDEHACRAEGAVSHRVSINDASGYRASRPRAVSPTTRRAARSSLIVHAGAGRVPLVGESRSRYLLRERACSGVRLCYARLVDFWRPRGAYGAPNYERCESSAMQRSCRSFDRFSHWLQWLRSGQHSR
jgi:hypothetical protein